MKPSTPSDTDVRLADKQTWRRTLLSRRASMTPIERTRAGDAIRQRLLAVPELVAAGTVFCFLSAGDEVDTHRVVDHLCQAGKQVLVPKIPRGAPMRAVPFVDWQDLVPGPLGIPAPSADEAFEGRVDVVITPGVGFTPTGSRLGYGKGYYDAWFATRPHDLRIAIAFDCQVVESLPVTATDVPVHRIVTETRLIHVSSAH